MMTGTAPRIAHEDPGTTHHHQQDDSNTDYIYDLTAQVGHKLVGIPPRKTRGYTR